MKDDRTELREVEIGKRSGIAAEIVTGIEEGEKAINHPGDNILPGTRVRYR